MPLTIAQYSSEKVTIPYIISADICQEINPYHDALPLLIHSLSSKWANLSCQPWLSIWLVVNFPVQCLIQESNHQVRVLIFVELIDLCSIHYSIRQKCTNYFINMIYIISWLCANNRVRYGLMIVYGYLRITLPHYQYYADLCEDIELLKCLSDLFYLECVPKIRSVLSIIFHAIYETLCIESVELTQLSYNE